MQSGRRSENEIEKKVGGFGMTAEIIGIIETGGTLAGTVTN